MAGIAIGKAGRIDEQKRLAPVVRAFALPGAVHRHVVGRPFARAAVPAHQEIAIGTFDDPRCVVALGVQRED